jgi:metal-responsive CopG/Arc/MetJ family transcriptional regulator
MPATKVTLSLPAELLALVDRYVAEHQDSTRSSICARALRLWLRQVEEEEIERYYATLTDEERAESEAWNDAAAYSAALSWK